MSRAFVKEGDGAGEALPELAISPHLNLVTPAGLALIEARVTTLEAELRAARGRDDQALSARIGRDLRYWTQRRSSARVVTPPAGTEPDVARFGVSVTVRFDDGSERVFKLVGEDEADPARGLLSYAAPLGRALAGRGLWEEVTVAQRNAKIIALTY